MKLVFRSIRSFSKSRLEVLLLKDVPNLGFEGQVVTVKPGYASLVLFPNRWAIYNMPGVRQRVFPDVQEEDIQKRITEANFEKFRKKLEDLKIILLKEPSSTNPDMLKTPLVAREILPELRNRCGMDLENHHIKLDREVINFGKFEVSVEDYHDERYKMNLSFKFTVEIRSMDKKKEAAKEEKKTPGKAAQAPEGAKPKITEKAPEGGAASKEQEGGKKKEKK